MFENVDGWTTDGRQSDWILLAHPWAFGSCELITNKVRVFKRMADHSHEISYLIFLSKIRKDIAKFCRLLQSELDLYGFYICSSFSQPGLMVTIWALLTWVLATASWMTNHQTHIYQKVEDCISIFTHNSLPIWYFFSKSTYLENSLRNTIWVKQIGSRSGPTFC